ncbi:hypothetical protein B0H63DRAFT_76913 [Podospora didyma]|uniref:AA1-like domain-containing protein n=1 Tax=Podospora didyma TaxID=330526 RepID=A0AAE0K2Q9_9PEZI|nr:hypothetical protein B0H63DRAFT_76913 [Podospora didyma]
MHSNLLSKPHHLLLFSLVLAAAVIATTTPPTLVHNYEYGYWNASIAGGSSASGFKWRNLQASYFSSAASTEPQSITSCRWVLDMSAHSKTSSCNNTLFSYIWGETIVTLKETVEIRNEANEAISLAVSGTIPINYRCGLGGSGRECTTSAFLMNATAPQA